MAKKKTLRSQNTQEAQEKAIDLELITHKYSDYYQDSKNAQNDDENALVQKIDMQEQQDTSYYWYDTKWVFYPMYVSKVTYDIVLDRDIHPIILSILKSIKKLESLQDINIGQTLGDITQLDSEILGSILADLETKGFIKIADSIKLSDSGKEALQKEKEKIRETRFDYVLSDGICGEMLDKAEKSKNFHLSKPKVSKDVIELKPKGKKRLRFENLDELFDEGKTLSLEQMLREILSPTKGSESYDIEQICAISESKKYFKEYICLFYKNKSEEEKILALNERLEIDKEATKLLDKLIDTSNFNPSKNQAYQDNKQKFEESTPEIIEEQLNIDLSEGKTLQTQEHKKYLKYTLANAKEAIYIQSPWIRVNILREYQSDIESALKRGVKVQIKYGLKPRNRFDKTGIDEDSKNITTQWSKNYPKLFMLKQDNNHSKILICDREFMIIGSFNWLSFGGESQNGEKPRDETSSINKNKDSIAKEIAKFN